MVSYLLQRLAAALLLIWLLLTVVFFVLQLAPGDPLLLFDNPQAPPEVRESLARVYGLDQPLPMQYVHWMSAIVLRWDWGTSFVHRRPVTQVLADALPNTLLLATTAILIDLFFGITLGTLAARRRESAVDHSIRWVTLLLYSIPGFWLALMGILLLSMTWPLFPPSHMQSVGASDLPLGPRLLDLAWHLTLPALVLGVSSCGSTVRLVRNSLLEVLEQDYIRTARAKGLSETRILGLHALRNAIGPVIQFVGFAFPMALNGSLVAEVIFSWPGLGRLTFEAIHHYDYPLVLGGTAMSGMMVVGGSLLADLAQALADPRLRSGRGGEGG